MVPSQARLRRPPCRSGIPSSAGEQESFGDETGQVPAGLRNEHLRYRDDPPARIGLGCPERETGPRASVSWQETRTSRASRSTWIRGRGSVADAVQAGFSGETLHGVIQNPGQDPRRAARARQHRHPHPVRDTRQPRGVPPPRQAPEAASPRSPAGRADHPAEPPSAAAGLLDLA
jgi:hypothetical protein